jgi:hypothetical protein
LEGWRAPLGTERFHLFFLSQAVLVDSVLVTFEQVLRMGIAASFHKGHHSFEGHHWKLGKRSLAVTVIMAATVDVPVQIYAMI